MTPEEIFKQLLERMLEGLMMHDQFIEYYEFLGLPYYAKCHEKRFKDENKNYRKIYHYYMITYNKLIVNKQIKQPAIIPNSWSQYTRQDVDSKTKQSSVKEGLEYWLAWEKETCDFYERMYTELMNFSKVADAEQVKKLISDVQLEVEIVQQYHLNKVAIDFNMGDIIAENDIDII